MSIATQIAALQQDKTDIATAITNKGGTVNSGDGFDDFAADIATIPSGGGDTVTATNNTGSAISNGDKVWINRNVNGYNLLDSSETIKNFQIKGASVNDSTHIASSFGTNNYLSLDNQKSYTSNTITSLEMVFKVHTPTSGNWATNGRLINATSNFDDFALDINQSRAQFAFINSDVYDDKALQVAPALNSNTDYWFKITYDGTNLKGFYSTDGVNYTQQSSITRSSSELYIGTTFSVGNRTYDHSSVCVWKGTIDLKETYIDINNQPWWHPYVPNITKDTMTGTASENIAVSGTGDVYIGNVIEPTISSLSITPSTSAQTFNSSSVDGYKPVSVSAVTSAIDSNITAGNIKSGVSILGVTGNYTGTTPSGTISITDNGTYDVTNYASASVSVSGGGGSDWVTSTEFSISLNKSYWQLGNIVDSVGYRIVGEDSNGNIKVIGCLYDANGNVITKSNNHYLSLTYDDCEYVEGDGVYLVFCDASDGKNNTIIFIDLSGE